MNRNKSQKTIISTGIVSIVLIFVMLSMLTFAVLSLTSAQANLRLSRLSADRTTSYYEAENAANDILIRVNDTLNETYPLADSQADFCFLAQNALADINDIDFPDDSHVAYGVPLGNNQTLAVELALTYEPSDGGKHYSITSWQAVSAYDWSPDETLNLGIPIF